MASLAKAASVGGWSWSQILQAIHQTGKAILRALKIKLTLLDPEFPEDEVNLLDLFHLMYHFNEKLKNLSCNQQRAIKTVLASIFSVCTYHIYRFLLTTGGDRWVLNPLISEFHFPTIPHHAMKVFIFFKYGFAICLVYNMMKYAVDRKEEMVALMDELERDAAILHPGQSPETRLDASVPRPGDSAKQQEARQLVAIRRLLHRGEFIFDVFPEPEHIEEPKPTEDDILLVREAMELEAVKRLNDPRILREYIRRRESRQSRRQVHLYRMRELKKKVRSKALKIIQEETSASQLKQHKATPKIDAPSWGITKLTSVKVERGNFNLDFRGVFPSVSTTTQVLAEFLPCMVKHRGRKYDRSSSASPPRAAPLQAAKWPVSGTCRPTRSRRPSTTLTLYVRDSRTNAAAESSGSQRHYTPTNRRRGSSGGSDIEPTNAFIIQPWGHRAWRSSDSSSSPPKTPPPRPKVAEPPHSDLVTRSKGSMSRRKETPTSTAPPFASKMSPLAAKLIEKRRPTTSGDENVQDKECPQPAQSAKERPITPSTSPKSPANARGHTSNSTRSPSAARRPTVIRSTTAGALKRSSCPGSASAASRNKQQDAGTRDVTAISSTLDERELSAACPENTATVDTEAINNLSCVGSAPEAGDTTGSGNVPGTASLICTSSPDRRLVVAETIYGIWRDNVISKRLKEGGSNKSTFVFKYSSYDTTPESRVKPKSQERRLSAVRGSTDAAGKATEGDKVRKLVQHLERRESRAKYRPERRSKPRPEQQTVHQSDERSEHQPERRSQHRTDKHPELLTEKHFDPSYEKHLESPAKKHSEPRSELPAEKQPDPHSEKDLEPRSEQHVEPPIEVHFERRQEQHVEPPIEVHFERRPEQHVEPPIEVYFKRQPEQYVEPPIEVHFERRSEKHGEHSDRRSTKYTDPGAEKYSPNRVDKHPEPRNKKSSEHRTKKDRESRAEGHSGHRAEKLSERRAEGHSAHQDEKHLERRSDRHSGHRAEKLSECRAEGHSAHQDEKHLERRPKRHSGHRAEKLSERRAEGHSALQDEKHLERIPEKHSGHRAEKLPVLPQIEKHSERREKILAESGHVRYARQRTEGADHRTDEFVDISYWMHEQHHPEKSFGVTPKELKKVQTEYDPMTDVPTYSSPTSGTEETSGHETRGTGGTTGTGSDAQSYLIGKTESVSVIKAKQKTYLQISNLLEPRGNWSDSVSSLSGISPSITSTIRAFTDLEVIEEPADTSESH